MFLEECKFVVKEKNMSQYVTDDLEISSDDSDRKDSNEEMKIEDCIMKKLYNYNEEILMKKIKYRIAEYKLQNIILTSRSSLNTHIIYVTHTIKLIFKHYFL